MSGQPADGGAGGEQRRNGNRTAAAPSPSFSIDVTGDEWQADPLATAAWLPIQQRSSGAGDDENQTDAATAAAAAAAAAAVAAVATAAGPRSSADSFGDATAAQWEEHEPPALLTPPSRARSWLRTPGGGLQTAHNSRSATSMRMRRSSDSCGTTKRRGCCDDSGGCARLGKWSRRVCCARWSFARLFSVLTTGVLLALVAVVWVSGIHTTISIVHEIAETTRDALMDTAAQQVSLRLTARALDRRSKECAQACMLVKQ